ncbi:MAG: protein translocase subunit SecF [Candidatus Pacebacteria bacterium]|nr:protein translocase subunit SecF [Candidatus Paceibacterota bacterium]
MRLLPEKLAINFMGMRFAGFALSGALVLASIILPMTWGLNFGIDFSGGILMEVRSPSSFDLAATRSSLNSLGLGEVAIQQFGDGTDMSIRVQEQEGGEQAQQAAIGKIKESLGKSFEFRKIETVGPKVGSELKKAGSLAAILAVSAIGIYIWFRFEWQYGLAALIALAHDVITTVGIYAVTQVEFNLSTVAAILTVAGYSINDTVVIFDRVREDRRKYRSLSVIEMLNLACNETLSRTILTSMSTFIAVLALYLVGGEALHSFSIGVLWGIIAGTYSSVLLATPLLIYFGSKESGSTEVLAPDAKDETVK